MTAQSYDIQKQIDRINTAIDSIRGNRPDEYDSKFLKLVEERRKLKVLADTSENNPAIAVYGAVHTGKSYLINSILQKDGKPFMLETKDGSYNFMEEVTPKNWNVESTGVLTRFSSFSNNPSLYSEDYPILMRCLSVTDILIILSHGYYNDVYDYSCPSEKEIEEKAESIYNKYRNAQPNPDSPIQPDDMLTMKHYFKQHINNAYPFYRADFFDIIALVADRIPSDDWLDVFEILWNRSPYQTKLFNKMIDTLAQLKYAKYVYLPTDAILHNNISSNAIMSVQCLIELFEPQSKYFTEVYLRSGDSYTKLTGISKSEVCAICAEIIIKIGNEWLENVKRYDLTGMSADSRDHIGDPEVTMTVFRDNDLLDFPGVYYGTQEQLETLESNLLLTIVFRRGKMAYLFNKYNEEKKINILLYCHHGEKNEVTNMPFLLGGWIKNNIGDTIEKRRLTISRTANISPLFYIGTKFNIDMEYGTESIANEENALKERWNYRFKKVLYKECFNVDGNLDAEKKRIFSNWTAPGESFRNSYILRDYKYSGPLASKLYESENTPEGRMILEKDFYELIRRTFIEDEHVKQFFNDPELAWDVCATMNNDGSLYIIQNLTKIAETTHKTRRTQFEEICRISDKKITDLTVGNNLHNDNRNSLITDFKMSYDIQKQIDNINSSIDWIRKNRPNEYDNKFLKLVEERRKLKVIADASETNPGIAAYGVSQVGKSYLMNCMLQKDGKPFMLQTKDRSYKFIEEMNPKTKNVEATGVVTRFTSFSNNPSLYSKEYPILMRCLSVTDILMILSDGYYNDVHDYSAPSEKEIEEKAEYFYNKYRNSQPNPDSPIQADDMLTMKHYFKRHINNAQSFNKSDFFDIIALVADRIPSNDWLDVFQILWNRSPYQTKLFNKMINTLAQLKYAKYVYLPPQALLHNGINENTVMSVQCLNELFEPQSKYFTEVYLRSGDSYTKLTGISKSEVCAICAEIIIKIGDELLNNVGRYHLNSMSTDSRNHIGNREVAMTIFQNNDMLDFPGARSRTQEQLETLESNQLLTNVFLRGKVAYLFNKYNEEKKINILLYCHHGEKNEVTNMPLLLGEWIKNNMGDTIEKRRLTISHTANISPLFYIGTKFNIDMEYSTEAIANEENSLKERWNARFKKVLYKECFNVDGNLDAEKKKIFSNWTAPGESFHNSYILRDYTYSGPLASKLFDLENTPEARMTIGKEYYELMRRTFIESEHVKQFFNNPELAWDVCATMNNDGSLYIIQNLTKIAETMRNARQTQFDDSCRTAIRGVIDSIKDYFISTDADEILKKNIRQANSIFRELEFACQSVPEYFGHLLQALQFSEAMSFKEVHNLIPTLNATVAGDDMIKDYELIRKRCNNFDGCKKEDEKWQRLIEAYRFTDRAECEEFLKVRGIDPAKLFVGDHVKRKNSAVIAHSLMNSWRKAITSVQFMSSFTDSSSIDQATMNNLVNCLIATADSIGLEEFIMSQIAEYTDILNTTAINENLVADIIATTISDFVTNFGFNFLSESQKEAAKRLSKENKLPAFDWISRERKEHYPEEDITTLFNSILDSADRFTPSYEANYNAWLEYMYIAFIAHINVPEFDREANDRLKALLDLLRA